MYKNNNSHNFEYKEKSLYKGRIIEVISRTFQSQKKVREIAQRAPGVRILIVKENSILLTKEFRLEVNNWDYRLPGGKVFDDLDCYLKHKNKVDSYIIDAVKREALEEAGVAPLNFNFIHKSIAGATIIWDLYYYEVTKFEKVAQRTEEDEYILPEWKTFNEVIDLCCNKSIQEDRTVAVLFRYIMNKIKVDNTHNQG